MMEHDNKILRGEARQEYNDAVRVSARPASLKSLLIRRDPSHSLGSSGSAILGIGPTSHVRRRAREHRRVHARLVPSR